MFSAIAKIVKGMASYPRAVTAVLFVLALLCIYPINHLRWELQLQDTLIGSEVQQDYQAIEDAFGGLGSLTVILQSDDSLKNYKLAENFARTFENDSLIHFIEYSADVGFFERNRLLYASEEDLFSVLTQIESIREKETMRNNPFYVDLETPEDGSDSSREPTHIIRNAEEKYFRNLQQSYANKDGTIRVIDIYPTRSLTDLQANRDLFRYVSGYMKQQADPKGIKVLYTGKVYKSIQTGKMLLPEAKIAGGITALVILILLIVRFYKHPQLILISAIPMALPMLFTLALAYFLYGRINLFTLPIAIFLPAHACQILVHTLSRYFHEREKNLSSALCIESALLGIVPPVAASSFILAGLSISLNLIPLPGLQEFGTLNAIGSLLNLIVCPLLATAFLRLSQQRKIFSVNSLKIRKRVQVHLLPTKINWTIIIVLSIASLAGIIYSGFNLSYAYDFKQTEIQHDQKEVDALIKETGFSTYDPIIIMMPDSSYSNSLIQDFSHLQQRGVIPSLGRIYTQYQFLPKETQGKKGKVEYLKKQATPQFLSRLGTEDSTAIESMLQNYEADFKEFELSPRIKQKFSSKNGNDGVFAFIIPNEDPNNGLACRRINKQLQELEGIQDKQFKVCGTPVLRAAVLDLILSNVFKSIVLGTVLLWFVMLLFFNNLSHALFVMLPSIFAMSWLTIILHTFNYHISAYSSLAFVLIIGASVDGSLQLWSSYFEKQDGTAMTVLKTKLSSVVISQWAAFLTPFALIFSSHPGIRGTGIITLIGFICIFVAQITIYPLIAGALDQYRLRKKQRLENESTLH